MTTTREEVSEMPNDVLIERMLSHHTALIRSGHYEAEYKLYRAELERRLLALTSSGGVTDEDIQAEANRRYPHNNSDALEDKIKNLSQRSAFCNGARWLRSKGKVRVPLFKLVDPIRIEQVVPLRVEVGDHIHTVQPVIEGNTIVWRWPTHTAQD